MKMLSQKLCKGLGNRFCHYCPGCKQLHGFYVDSPNPSNGARWQFDGNLSAPTFNPSMNITAHDEEYGIHDVCHYFLRAGKLQFLSDCTHKLAGQEVELPDLPEWVVKVTTQQPHASGNKETGE